MFAEHLGISAAEYERLSASVPAVAQMKEFEHFTVSGKTDSPEFGFVNLLVYIDRHGTEFMRSEPKTNHGKMARAIYNSLPAFDKLKALQYAEGHDDGWPESADEASDEEAEDEE